MADKRRLVFISSGDFESPMGIRARSFAVHLGQRWKVLISYQKTNKLVSLVNNILFLLRYKPDKVVVLDCHFSGVVAGIFYFLFFGKSYLLDTGDAIFELGKAIGRSNTSLFLTYLLEYFGFLFALRVIVRGRGHFKYLGTKAKNAIWIPDGVNVKQFIGNSCGLDSTKSSLVIGLIGSLSWNSKTEYCYGMELIEVVYGLVRQNITSVQGIIIGDGSGLKFLKKRVFDLGLEGYIQFLGKVRYDDLPPLISKFSVALSNQTNDKVGDVRTTGKLPLYLSSGCFIFSTKVGEASRILPNEMLISISGFSNTEFSDKVIERIVQKLNCGDSFNYDEGPSIAKKFFEYSNLSLQYEKAILTKHKTCPEPNLPAKDHWTQVQRSSI
jgi:glycosyltransferase involved in cell wall biosynthesis